MKPVFRYWAVTRGTTGHWQIALQRISNVELWCIICCSLNISLNDYSSYRSLRTPWQLCNFSVIIKAFVCDSKHVAVEISSTAIADPSWPKWMKHFVLNLWSTPCKLCYLNVVNIFKSIFRVYWLQNALQATNHTWRILIQLVLLVLHKSIHWWII